MELRRIAAGPARTAYLSLLLLADDAADQVLAYMQEGDLYALHDDTSEPMGIVLAIPGAAGTIELKSIAVAAEWQGHGIGRMMLSQVLERLRRQGWQRVIVGTGNSSIGPLALYQKVGFRLWKIERDFFSEDRGYPPGLEENGIPLRDMVWLDLRLQQPNPA